MGSLHVALDVTSLRRCGYDDDLSDIWRWAAERDIPVADDADTSAHHHLRATFPRLVPTRELAQRQPTLWVPAGFDAPGPEPRRPTVRIRGARSDPGVAPAVEAALASADEVDECAVVAARSEAGIVLVAYVTLLPGWRTDPAALLSWLGRRVPPPAELVVLDRLPRTPSGEVDRPALALRLT